MTGGVTGLWAKSKGCSRKEVRRREKSQQQCKESANTTITLNGTAGQSDPGLLTGGGYSLDGGFWGGGALPGSQYRTYLPLVLRYSP